jgi:hypothetical protein
MVFPRLPSLALSISAYPDSKSPKGEKHPPMSRPRVMIAKIAAGEIKDARPTPDSEASGNRSKIRRKSLKKRNE